MTEEDTFLKLKQVDVDTMDWHWLLSPLNSPKDINNIPDEVVEFFRQYGWEYKAWLNAWHVKHQRYD